jgi:hypothetical protein
MLDLVFGAASCLKGISLDPGFELFAQATTLAGTSNARFPVFRLVEILQWLCALR